MREILFRGKRIDNGVWVKGLPFSFHANINTEGIETYDGERHRVDPTTVGQSTGLTDKNGKKIFEGDILKWDADEYGSAYNEICSWDYELLNMRKNDWKDWCEVIGNIHDNLE